MKSTARSGDDEDRPAGLGERLKAWFAALSGQPTPDRLLKHVEELDRQSHEPASAPPRL